MPPSIKYFNTTRNLVPFNASHSIALGKKVFDSSKASSRNNKPQIFKSINLLGTNESYFLDNIAFAFIEVISGEFFRVLIPETQPKTRFSQSQQSNEYGILSSEIKNFIPIQNAIFRADSLKKQELKNVKSKINQIGLGKIMIGSLWLGEFDLKLGNIGTEMDSGVHLYKIDHGCCLPATWRKYNTSPESATNNKPILENFLIQTETIAALPRAHGYGAYNWLDLINNNEIGTSERFLESSLLDQLTQDPTFRTEVNSTILKIILLSDDDIRNFVSTYKLQFLNIEGGKYDYFIEEVAEDIRIELIERRTQLLNAALNNISFIQFLNSPENENTLQKMNADFSNFTLFKKYVFSASGNLAYTRFLDQMDMLKKSIQSWSDKLLKYPSKNTILQRVFDAANELYTSVENGALDYFQGSTTCESNKIKFKEVCDDVFNKVSTDLNKSQIWKVILGNLALAIAGLGIGFLIAGFVNLAVTTGKDFLFFKNNDFVTVLKNLTIEIDNALDLEPSTIPSAREGFRMQV